MKASGGLTKPMARASAPTPTGHGSPAGHPPVTGVAGWSGRFFSVLGPLRWGWEEASPNRSLVRCKAGGVLSVRFEHIQSRFVGLLLNKVLRSYGKCHPRHEPKKPAVQIRCSFHLSIRFRLRILNLPLASPNYLFTWHSSGPLEAAQSHLLGVLMVHSTTMNRVFDGPNIPSCRNLRELSTIL